MNLNYHILYVKNPTHSEAFYTDIFQIAPRECSPTFVLYDLPGETKLGLWAQHTVEPEAQLMGGGSELGICVASLEQVQEIYRQWQEKGITILQQLCAMDFGHTFVGQDPDGHRLRIFALHQS